ncbi:hypothetical protein HispidOSU_025329, partial [Sigmodon hispidus]
MMKQDSLVFKVNSQKREIIRKLHSSASSRARTCAEDDVKALRCYSASPLSSPAHPSENRM